MHSVRGKHRIKWYHGVFKASYLSSRGRGTHISSSHCVGAPWPRAVPCPKSSFSLHQENHKAVELQCKTFSIAIILFCVLLSNSLQNCCCAYLFVAWRAGGGEDFHMFLQSVFLLPPSCFSHWLYLSLSSCILHSECCICPPSLCFLNSWCDAKCSCTKNNIEVINSEVIYSKQQWQLFP